MRWIWITFWHWIMLLCMLSVPWPLRIWLWTPPIGLNFEFVLLEFVYGVVYWYAQCVGEGDINICKVYLKKIRTLEHITVECTLTIEPLTLNSLYRMKLWICTFRVCICSCIWLCPVLCCGDVYCYAQCCKMGWWFLVITVFWRLRISINNLGCEFEWYLHIG